MIDAAFLHALCQAVDEQRLDDLESVYHRDAVYERPGYQPLTGAAAIMAFYRKDRVIAEGRHHLEQVIVWGDTGAAWGAFAGRSKTGEALQERFADSFVFRDGQVFARRTHFFRPAI